MKDGYISILDARNLHGEIGTGRAMKALSNGFPRYLNCMSNKNTNQYDVIQTALRTGTIIALSTGSTFLITGTWVLCVVVAAITLICVYTS